MCLSSWLLHIGETFSAHDVVSTVTIVGPKSCWHDSLVDCSVNSGPWILAPSQIPWVSQQEKLGQRCAWTACWFVRSLIQQILMRHLLHACVAFGAEWTGGCTLCCPEAHVPSAEHKPLAAPGRGGAGRQLANPARLSRHPLELRASAIERLSETLADWQPLCRKRAKEKIAVVTPRGHCHAKRPLSLLCERTSALCGSAQDVRTSVQNWPERWVWESHAEWEEEEWAHAEVLLLANSGRERSPM